MSSLMPARPDAEPGTIEVLERELARAYRIERALRDVGLALGTTLDIDALLRLILERTTEALEAERATLYLVESRGDRQVLVSRVVDGGLTDPIVLQLGEGIAGDVAKFGRPANVRDAYQDPRFSAGWDERTGFRTKSVLAVPLRSQLGRIVGVIQVLNKRPGSTTQWPTFSGDEGASRQAEAPCFDEDDEALLTALATQAAVSIEQAQLFVSILDKNRELSVARSALEKKVQDLHVLFAIERATARATSREDLALAFLPEAARAVGARTAFVVLADDAGDLTLFHLGRDAVAMPSEGALAPPERGARTSVFPLSSPSPTSGVHKLRVKAGEGLIGTAMQTAESLLVADMARDGSLGERLRQSLFPGGSDIGAPAAVVPLLDARDEAFGALVVVRAKQAPAFDLDELDFLRLIALNASTGFLLEAAREARVREERMSTIGSLMSGMMHDLKTPMTVISGYVQMMTDSDDRATRLEYAELVHRQFDHIAAMQREVLAFARGERSVLVRRVYLAKFFGEIEQQLRHEIQRRRVPVELSFDLQDRGTARFDEAKITRAVHNLARNAIEAMGERGGTLTLRVAQPGGVLEIVVADTGPGLPPEVQERLFESFVTSGKRTGTGLGLAIVKKIALDHGGTIEAQSSSAGARFVLRIPQPPVTKPRP